MKYILTYWNFKKQEFSTMELDGEIERDNVISYLKCNGWVKKNGVWYYNIEA